MLATPDTDPNLTLPSLEALTALLTGEVNPVGHVVPTPAGNAVWG